VFFDCRFSFSSFAGMSSSRHEAKKAYLQLKLLVKFSKRSLISKKELHELFAVEKHLKQELLKISLEKVSSDIILRRRQALEDNNDLKQIFSLFWLVLSVSTADGILEKDEYINFHLLLLSALIGDAIDPMEAREIAESDYRYDTFAFGEINEVVFFDIMASTIGQLSSLPTEMFAYTPLPLISLSFFSSTEVWADMVSPKYHSAFAWALLGSTVDVKSFPPRFNPRNRIRCITTIHSEQVQ
jgi:hypothetical protein